MVVTTIDIFAKNRSFFAVLNRWCYTFLLINDSSSPIILQIVTHWSRILLRILKIRESQVHTNFVLCLTHTLLLSLRPKIPVMAHKQCKEANTIEEYHYVPQDTILEKILLKHTLSECVKQKSDKIATLKAAECHYQYFQLSSIVSF